MPTGSGFTVDHNALDATAGQLDRTAADLDGVRARLQNAPDFTADNYGEAGMADAANNFHASWQDELQVDTQAVREMADKLRLSAANYRAVDQTIVNGLHRQAL